MVMKPEPWGEAFDELGLDNATLVVPTPAGRPFTQALARDLAGRERLVFACGRYEGIDQRVADHAATRAEVVEVSLGDYVLNGGEVAALAITEAVVRLLPGFMGNPDCWSRSPTRTGCSRARSSRDRPRGAAWTSPTCSRVATTPRSPRGGPSRRCAGPRSAVPTSSTRAGRASGRSCRRCEPTRGRS
jgi:hypothetical protein